jgi:ankyrin repeat protein
MTTIERFTGTVRYLQPRISLQAFQSLLPGIVSQEPYRHSLNMTAANAMLETNFTQLLLFSITNGLAGLRDMPIAGVFKFLSRYGSVNAVFGQILQANPRHVARSLAENLFRVAIEAQESDIITQLIASPLVQVNTIVCWVNGRKFTAAERAAQLRDLKTLTVLLRAGTDVNKTYASRQKWGGVLRQLVVSIRGGETIPDVIRIVPAILRAGAKVHVETLKYVIGVLSHSQLALCLLPSFLPTHDTDLISNGILWLITRELDHEEAREATQQIMQGCDLYHKFRCLQNFQSEVEWAFTESAKRGHLQVVQILLPYSGNSNRVVSASIRSRDKELVKTILDRDPDLTSPPVCLVRDTGTCSELRTFWDILDPRELQPLHTYSRETNDSYLDTGCRFPWTTPLAEAILTKDHDLLRICETKGAFAYIHISGHFEAALSAAATTGNSAYIHKLLHYVMLPSPDDMSTALLFSIRNGFHDISLELISRGADVHSRMNYNNVLLAAVEERSAPIVSAILDSGDRVFGHHPSIHRIVQEAIIWGDRSIISDLHYAIPYAKTGSWDYSYEELASANEDLWDLLAFVIELDLLGKETLAGWLAGPIKNRDTAMIMRLIELGAVPFEGEILSLAVQHHPEILGVLLGTLPVTTRLRTGFGEPDAICTAITLGLGGLESLDVLLSSNIWNFRGFLNKKSTPLGMAIKRALHYKGEFPAVKLLLEAGCDPNSIVAVYGVSDDHNMTALLAAIQTGNIDLVKFLISVGADVGTEAKRRLARTPLQLAAELGCLEIAQLLISEGASVNASPVPRGGGTALQLAAISGNCNIVAELLNQGADPWAPPSIVRGRWPIEGAAEHGRLDMIEYLLKVGIYDAEKCERAMELAQENGHMGCHDLIAEHIGKNVSDEQNSGMNSIWTI